MSDPNYSHEFDPNSKGRCKRIINARICGLDIDAEVHTRFWISGESKIEPITIQVQLEPRKEISEDDLEHCRESLYDIVEDLQQYGYVRFDIYKGEHSCLNKE